MCAPDLSLCLVLAVSLSLFTFWKCVECLLSLIPLWLSSLLQSHGPFLPSFCLSHLKYLQIPYDLMSAIAAHPGGVGKCYRNLKHILCI